MAGLPITAPPTPARAPRPFVAPAPESGIRRAGSLGRADRVRRRGRARSPRRLARRCLTPQDAQAKVAGSTMIRAVAGSERVRNRRGSGWVIAGGGSGGAAIGNPAIRSGCLTANGADGRIVHSAPEDLPSAITVTRNNPEIPGRTRRCERKRPGCAGPAEPDVTTPCSARPAQCHSTNHVINLTDALAS